MQTIASNTSSPLFKSPLTSQANPKDIDKLIQEENEQIESKFSKPMINIDLIKKNLYKEIQQRSADFSTSTDIQSSQPSSELKEKRNSKASHSSESQDDFEKFSPKRKQSYRRQSLLQRQQMENIQETSHFLESSKESKNSQNNENNENNENSEVQYLTPNYIQKNHAFHQKQKSIDSAASPFSANTPFSLQSKRGNRSESQTIKKENENNAFVRRGTKRKTTVTGAFTYRESLCKQIMRKKMIPINKSSANLHINTPNLQIQVYQYSSKVLKYLRRKALNWKKKRLKQLKPYLCHICEKSIEAYLIESHSKLCLEKRNIIIQGQSNDWKIRKLADELKKEVQMPNYPKKKSLLNKVLINKQKDEMKYIQRLQKIATQAFELSCTNPNSLQKLTDFDNELPLIQSKISKPFHKRIQQLRLKIKKKIENIVKLTQNFEQQIEDQEDITYQKLRLNALVTIRNNSMSPKLSSNFVIQTRRPESAIGRYGKVQDEEELPVFQDEISLWQKVSIKDFKVLKKLGQGGYGTVYLAKKHSSKDFVAIKVIKKEEILAKKCIDQIQMEKFILGLDNQNFAVNGLYTFQGRNHLYFVMEYMPGGNFGKLLKNRGCLDIETARFYISELILCLQFLHGKNIIHRDLKPENILLDEKGHIKLVDFGLSETQARNRRIESQNSYQEIEPQGFGGTSDYIAPEIILEQDHDEKSDVWAVGVLLYEMLVGIPPFNDESQEIIFKRIVERDIEEWEYLSSVIDPNAYDLIDQILTLDPKKRPGLEQLKQHKFFKNVRWNKIFDEETPFKPKMKDLEKISPQNITFSPIFYSDKRQVKNIVNIPTTILVEECSPNPTYEDAQQNENKNETFQQSQYVQSFISLRKINISNNDLNKLKEGQNELNTKKHLSLKQLKPQATAHFSNFNGMSLKNVYRLNQKSIDEVRKVVKSFQI